jgi:choline dehydrogenase
MNLEYDFVVVGAGAAGCVLANRLTEDGRHSVLVIEAGGSDHHPWIKIPAGFTRTVTDPALNWGYVNAPAAPTNHRPIVCPRGRVVGGSSSINGHLYVRGQAADYDTWSEAAGEEWSWNALLPYFMKAESGELSDLPGRGGDGNLRVNLPRLRHPLCDLFFESAAPLVSAGRRDYGVTPEPGLQDYNDGIQEGVGYYQYLMHRGRRWSAADAYLRPAMRRDNLQLVTRTPVTRLLYRDGQVSGVEALVNGIPTTFAARREVILAAGAIATPHLLQCSGIGNPAWLSEAGIEPRVNLPGVGKNMVDHYVVRISKRVTGISSLNERSHGVRLGAEVIKYLLARRGLLTSAVAHGYGFVRSDPRLERADIQFFFAPASYPSGQAGVASLEHEPGMTCGVSQLRPFSRGYVRSQSPDPLEVPVVQPNYLADDRDLETFRRGVRLVRRLFQADPLARHVADETWPGSQVESDEQIDRFVRDTGATVYHPVGSCAMGRDADAVVDSSLRVNGLQGIRIIDASVMPSMVSGNTYAATIAVAEKGSDLVLAAHKNG